MNFSYKAGFPNKKGSFDLVKKIDKTKEARQGDPIYKRRNPRHTNRSIMQLVTYNELKNKNQLDKYKMGYVVLIKPKEYFDSISKKRRSDLDEDLELGVNCFVYYDLNDDDWNEYNPIEQEGWEQVVENTTDKDDWSGHFAVNIRNASQQKLSFITRDKKTDDINNSVYNWMTDDIKNVTNRVKDNDRDSVMGGKGLGNFEYDYCDTLMMEKVLYQISYLMWKTTGMKEYIIDLAVNKKIPINLNGKSISIINDKFGSIENYINECEKHVETYCQNNNLIDANKLEESNILKNDKTICPLCLKKINPDEFFTGIEQDSGRKSSQNTIKKIELMHVEPLHPEKLNHTIYNLGWGHHYCNLFQGGKSIEETKKLMISILEQSGYKIEKK